MVYESNFLADFHHSLLSRLKYNEGRWASIK
jgi:hypothetical protein